MSSGPTVYHDRTSTHEGERIVRYTFGERVNHWIAGLAYIYLLMTGLAFYTPYLFWLAAIVGGGASARFWHPWVGLVFTVSALWMFNLWEVDMRITDDDRAWQRDVEKYVKNRDDELPPVGRFNWGQKQFFWVIFWCTIALLLSGLLLWFTEGLTWGLRFLRYLAILVHVSAALISIGAMMIHVYMGVLFVRGSVHAMVHGDVTPTWARTHHRLWYNRITGKSRNE
jgi:formate dehydrogenase subunit gamma